MLMLKLQNFRTFQDPESCKSMILFKRKSGWSQRLLWFTNETSNPFTDCIPVMSPSPIQWHCVVHDISIVCHGTLHSKTSNTLVDLSITEKTTGFTKRVDSKHQTWLIYQSKTMVDSKSEDKQTPKFSKSIPPNLGVFIQVRCYPPVI